MLRPWSLPVLDFCILAAVSISTVNAEALDAAIEAPVCLKSDGCQADTPGSVARQSAYQTSLQIEKCIADSADEKKRSHTTSIPA